LPIRIGNRRLEVLLVRSANGSEIIEGSFAADQRVLNAAGRAGSEQLGLDGTPIHVATVGSPADGVHLVYAYAVRPPPPGRRLPPSHLAGAAWRSAWDPGELIGPEAGILNSALAALAGRVEHADTGFLFVRPEFTVTELRRVHECFSRADIDPSNFRKRVARWVEDDRVRELPRRRATATRPARLYTHRNAEVLLSAPP
jgi:8-oxo-dGTP diphosphatase